VCNHRQSREKNLDSEQKHKNPSWPTQPREDRNKKGGRVKGTGSSEKKRKIPKARLTTAKRTQERELPGTESHRSKEEERTQQRKEQSNSSPGVTNRQKNAAFGGPVMAKENVCPDIGILNAKNSRRCQKREGKTFFLKRTPD